MTRNQPELLKSFHRWAGLLAVIGVMFVSILTAAFFWPTTPMAKSEKGETPFTCGMHPQISQRKPGSCPLCGMKLTPLAMERDGAALSGRIRIDPVTRQNMGMRIALVTNGPLRHVIRTVGMVDLDETRLVEVTTKYKGWIEKLRVNTSGQAVKKGETLFDIYSPELNSAQSEYLLVLGSSQATGTTGDALLTSERTKLAYLNMSEDQIARLEKERQARQTMEVRSPRDGLVLEKMVVEGQLVDAGMKLYRIADLSTVWVLCQVYEKDLPEIKSGQDARVRLSYRNDLTYPGKVAFIYPVIDEKTRTVRVRLELPNPELNLKPGMFATAELRVELSSSALLVPDMAVLRSGDSNTVFVALAGGRFEPRKVKLGIAAENAQYQVLEGLEEGERVVISGQFMLDAECQLREAMQKMAPVSASGFSTPFSTVHVENRRDLGFTNRSKSE